MPPNGLSSKLADIEKDGQMLAVAAKLLKGVGPVAIPKQAAGEGKPEFYDVNSLLKKAEEMGGDVGQAQAMMAQPSPKPQADYCAIGYWRESCDYNNYCRWEYVC
jgi:hypothetical protein